MRRKKRQELEDMRRKLFEYPIYADDLFFPYNSEQRRYDPEGSYTGTVAGAPYEQPVQDADDL